MECGHRYACLFLGLGALLSAACTPKAEVYVTDHGLGPDKWATAWLLTHRVSPGAELKVVPIGQKLPSGTPFDVPGSPVLRRGTLSAFETAIEHYKLTDADTLRFGRIVHDIEIGAWASSQDADSPIVEHAFRQLQERYGRDSVPNACYAAFFQDLDQAIVASRTAGAPIKAESLNTNCDHIVSRALPGKIVAEVPIDQLLGEMRQGKKVVFVDVREADEFAEAHVPGALNVPIRDKEKALSMVKDADIVVSYCIKDFRGFEMAKALKDAGIENSVILKPYGIRGWVAEGMPTVGSKAMTPADGARRMSECAQSPDRCPPPPTGKH